MGPVLVRSNTIAVYFATLSLLKSTIENAYISYLVFFFARKFNVEYESDFLNFDFDTPSKKSPVQNTSVVAVKNRSGNFLQRVILLHASFAVNGIGQKEIIGNEILIILII